MSFICKTSCLLRILSGVKTSQIYVLSYCNQGGLFGHFGQCQRVHFAWYLP